MTNQLFGMKLNTKLISPLASFKKSTLESLKRPWRYLRRLPKSFYVMIQTEIILLQKKARPIYLVLEPTNICNANCIFCAYQFDQRPKAEMEQKVFERCVDEFTNKGGKILQLTPFAGEIFIDKSLMSKLAYAKSKNLEVHTYTNASLLHKFNPKEILNSGLTRISISTAPFDETLYKQIYRNNLYKTVLRNIETLISAFHETDEKTVKLIEISFRADRSIKACKDLPDYQQYIAPHVKGNVSAGAMSYYDAWSNTIKQEDLLEGMTLLHSDRQGKVTTCPRIFSVQVTANNAIRLCGCRYDNNADYDELEIGNIQEMTVEEAYNSPEAKQKIKSFSRGEMLEVCKKCSWYDPEHW
jgi:MoaA/NifB/PqqE/SkfB family radical SAM enzyme